MTGQESETNNDFLSNGAYYYFDFERDAQSLGTYCNVKLNYLGFGNLGVPTQGYLNNDTYSIQHKIVYAVAIYNT